MVSVIPLKLAKLVFTLTLLFTSLSTDTELSSESVWDPARVLNVPA